MRSEREVDEVRLTNGIPIEVPFEEWENDAQIYMSSSKSHTLTTLGRRVRS